MKQARVWTFTLGDRVDWELEDMDVTFSVPAICVPLFVCNLRLPRWQQRDSAWIRWPTTPLPTAFWMRVLGMDFLVLFKQGFQVQFLLVPESACTTKETHPTLLYLTSSGGWHSESCENCIYNLGLNTRHTYDNILYNCGQCETVVWNLDHHSRYSMWRLEAGTFDAIASDSPKRCLALHTSC